MKTTQTVRKTRAHNVLFFRDTPYKAQRVELKTRYQRRTKHRLTKNTRFAIMYV